MKKLLLTLSLFFACAAAVAQQADSDLSEGDGVRIPDGDLQVESQNDVFYIPLAEAGDIWSRMARYNFQSARFLRRGSGPLLPDASLDGLELGVTASGAPDYILRSALRRVAASYALTPGFVPAPGCAGTLSGMEIFSVRPSSARPGASARLTASDRSARLGMDASSAGSWANGLWHYSLAVSRRWGRDAQIRGVFLDQTVLSASFERRLGKGSATLFILAAPCVSSSRTAAVQEVFDLTGDNLYNPSWGTYDGSERSSRVRKQFTPVAVLLCERPAGRAGTFRAAASATIGERSYSGITWYDAPNPLPDHYSYLPSHAGFLPAAEAISALWRSGDDRTVRIDWDGMALSNHYSPSGRARYMVDAAVERVRNLQFTASFHGRPGRRLETYCGLRFCADASELFDRAEDMLMSVEAYDYDPYNPGAPSDMRDPGRRIARGDKFRYHYRLGRSRAAGFLGLDYGSGPARLALALDAGTVTMRREGLYDKYGVPDGSSFGRSDLLSFPDYRLNLSAGYAFSYRCHAALRAVLAAMAPVSGDIYPSPRYCNVSAAGVRSTQVAGVESSIRMLWDAVTLEAAVFYNATGSQTEIMHYYDDLSAIYGNLVMHGVEKEYYGAELGMEARFSPRVSLFAAASAVSGSYANNPQADFYDDATFARVYSAKAFVRNCRTGSTPQSAATCEVRYRGVRGLMVSASVSCMADNYITPDPVRRMRRITDRAPSPEALAGVVAQERFAPQAVAGLFVSRSFDVGGGRMTFSASVNNLLDNRDIIYSGYEQMRYSRSSADYGRSYTVVPMPSKYLYSRGRTWFTSVTYRF